MPTMDELDYGEELRGVVCPECGSSLVRFHKKAWCDWCDSYVVPVVEPAMEVRE